MYEYKCGQIIMKKKFPSNKYVIVGKEVEETIITLGNKLKRTIKYNVLSLEYASRILEGAKVGNTNIFSCAVYEQQYIDDNFLVDVNTGW